MTERDLDVVVFGATSYTGRRVAAYLAERAEETGARWGAAARDAAKLERVLGEVGVSAPETIVAELGDAGSLAAMASRARVVVNLVGPYTLYGRPVIEACVAGGAHYVDLTGEMPFVRRMIDAFDAKAAEARVKVVQTCGFESLPPDLAILWASEAARERWDEGLAEVDVAVSVRQPPGLPRPSDLLSGGTLQSLAAVIGDEDVSLALDPACLIEDAAGADAVRRRSPIAIRPRRGPNDQVLAPMTPAPYINPAVVQRTAALVAAERGVSFEPFRYREGVVIGGSAPTLPLRFAAAGALAAAQAGFGRLASVKPSLRKTFGSALSRILPSSGFGPSPDRLEDWSWRLSVDARTGGGRPVSVSVDAQGHPGYLTTARMLGEAGLLLAEPGQTPERFGCLTPAIALGTSSIDRFEAARMSFTLSS